MKADKISVALATYNGGRFLREQLESLYKQTRLPDEIVVSDDCSSDGTIKILEEYKNEHGLKYITHDINIGVNKNFEEAIRSCTGDYIAICDQDDIWFPEKISILHKKLKEIECNGPAIVSSQCFHINSEGVIVSKTKHIHKDSSLAVDTLLQPFGVTQGCSLMLNRQLLDCLKPFPSRDICIYDFYIGFVCASIGKKYNLAQPLMYYRHHENNAVASNALKKDSLFRKAKGFLKFWFNPFYLTRERRNALLFIEYEYGHMFKEDIRKIFNIIKKMDYKQSMIKKIEIIWGVKDLSVNKRINWIIGEIKQTYVGK